MVLSRLLSWLTVAVGSALALIFTGLPNLALALLIWTGIVCACPAALTTFTNWYWLGPFWSTFKSSELNWMICGPFSWVLALPVVEPPDTITFLSPVKAISFLSAVRNSWPCSGLIVFMAGGVFMDWVGRTCGAIGFWAPCWFRVDTPESSSNFPSPSSLNICPPAPMTWKY